ncbi:MAG: TIM barrel protein [Actinobacteria bacterium]|nr:TIM barrel protein [Actinomycetota bacterium]
MPKFAINTVLWTWPFSADRVDILEKVKGLGYDAVEFSVVDTSPQHLAKIRKEVTRLGLETIICGIPGPQQSIIDPDEKVRLTGVKFVEELLDVCSALDAKALIGPTYSVGTYGHVIEPGGREAAEKHFVECMKEIAVKAEHKGIRIAIEPLNRYESSFLNLAEDALRLIGKVDSPAVGLHLDPYHMNIEEPSFAGPIEQAGEKLYHFHICENDRGAPETGTINWDEIVTVLKKIGYDHYLSVEACDPAGLGPEICKLGGFWRPYGQSPDQIARDSLTFLKRTMG